MTTPLSDALKEELWEDYHEQLCSVSRGFAAGIDQWYTEISRDNPNSVYWKHRASQSTFDTRAETFQALVNGQIHGDLIQVITKGTNSVNSLGKEGSLRRSHEEIKDKEPRGDMKVRLKANVDVKPSMTLEGPPMTPDGKVIRFLHGPYWDDPEKHAHGALQLFAGPRPCHRFYFTDGEGEIKVKFIDAEHKGLDLYEHLRSGDHTYGQLKEQLSGPQQHLLLLAVLSDMVEPFRRPEPRSAAAAGCQPGVNVCCGQRTTSPARPARRLAPRAAPSSEFPEFRADPMEMLRKLQGAYGDVVHFKLVNNDCYLFAHPDDVRHVLRTNSKNFRKAFLFDRSASCWATASCRCRTRTTSGASDAGFAGAFHRKGLDSYVRTWYPAVESFLRRWHHHADTGETFDAFPEMYSLSFDLAARTLLSADSESAETEAVRAAFDVGLAHLKHKIEAFVDLR